MKKHGINVVVVTMLTAGTFISDGNRAYSQSSAIDTKVSPQIEVPTTKLDISDYYPGPNFMKILADDKNGLELSKKQKKTLAEWRKENHSKIIKKMEEIATLEKEMKALSQNNADSEEIMAKLNETSRLRKEIATTKLACRDHVMETLRSEQWDALVENYQNKYPFVERTRMMEVMRHVNPVPNYMQVINKDADELELTSEQKSVFDVWSSEHHPQMMEMANKVISLEKEIYQASLEKKPREEILEEIDETAKLRNDIVFTKTECRDMVVKTLEPAQWSILVEKAK